MRRVLLSGRVCRLTLTQTYTAGSPRPTNLKLEDNDMRLCDEAKDFVTRSVYFPLFYSQTQIVTGCTATTLRQATTRENPSSTRSRSTPGSYTAPRNAEQIQHEIVT